MIGLGMWGSDQDPAGADGREQGALAAKTPEVASAQTGLRRRTSFSELRWDVACLLVEEVNSRT